MEKAVFLSQNFSGVQAVKLCESDFSKEIRITMAQNAVMNEHKAPAAIIVQVLSGAIIFEVGGEKMALNELDLITLPPNTPHSLKALKNSIIRLSLSKSDNLNRVLSVIG